MLAIGGCLPLSPSDSVLNLCEVPQDGLAIHGREPASQPLVPTAELAAPQHRSAAVVLDLDHDCRWPSTIKMHFLLSVAICGQQQVGQAVAATTTR
jgi:hypothetical protein